ncbi:MAG: MFS transporter [Spirochaetota bacterium]
MLSPGIVFNNKFNFKKTFTAFQYPNYRLWFFGQLVSLLGTWMQTTAQGFLVFQITHSPAYLGYVSFAAGIPTWLFMLYGGVIADRIPRRTLLIITQSAMMILAFILASLTFLALVHPMQIIILAFLTGVVNAFDAPARQAFVLDMVERDDIANAIALNSTMFNTATATGPAVAGITYAAFGPGWCFTINGISYIAVIIALLRMKLKTRTGQPQKTSTISDLKEGLRYVVKHRAIRGLIFLIAIVSLFGMAFVTLIPAWAVKVLGGDAKTNGLLQSARGIGALIGTLFIASLGRFQFKGKLLTVGTFVFPSMLIVFSFIRYLPLSLLVLVFTGAGLILVFNLANSLVQSLVDDRFRGRIMGIYSLTFFGFMPLGGLIFGAMAESLGEVITIIGGCSVILIAAMLIFLFIPRLRRLA